MVLLLLLLLLLTFCLADSTVQDIPPDVVEDIKTMVNAVLTAKGEPQTEINDFYTALSHYRSKAGGSVPGGPGLINEIKEDDDFFNVLDISAGYVEAEIRSSLDESGAESGQVDGTVPGQVSSCLTLGHFVLAIKYHSEWFVENVDGEKKVKIDTVYSMSTTDVWDFEPNSGYSDLQNLIREIIPAVLAGPGEPYEIPVQFNDEETWEMAY